MLLNHADPDTLKHRLQPHLDAHAQYNAEYQKELQTNFETDDRDSHCRHLLTVPRIPIARAVSLRFTDISTSPGIAIPPHAFLMVDATIRIEPDDCVARAMGLSRRFARE